MRFSDVIGNSEAADRLRNMVDSGRIPHAIMLTAPEGVPKLALARAFVQYLHCKNPQNGEPCEVCPACRQHITMNHADTLYSYPIYKTGSSTPPACDIFAEEWSQYVRKNKVESYRQWQSMIKSENKVLTIYVGESDRIIRFMSTVAYSSRHKVVIMWLPERMNESTANKLLKIIEEPAENSIFVLVCEKPKELLETIRSRTQVIEMKRPSSDDIAKYLVEKFGTDMVDARAVAAASDGDILRAEEALTVDSEQSEFFQKFAEVMRMAYVADLKPLYDWAASIEAFKREKICRFFNYAAKMVRENYIMNLQVPELNYLTHEEQQFSVKFCPYVNDGNVEGIIKEIDRVITDILANGSAKIILFDFVIKLTIYIKKKR